MNVDNFPKWLLNNIVWFQFEGIKEQSDFHAQGNNIIFHSLLKLLYIFLIRLWKEGGLNSK